jgi:hypothetical protein
MSCIPFTLITNRSRSTSVSSHGSNARIKRVLLQSEQESEKNRRARKHLIKAVDDDDADNFILSGETAALISSLQA